MNYNYLQLCIWIWNKTWNRNKLQVHSLFNTFLCIALRVRIHYFKINTHIFCYLTVCVLSWLSHFLFQTVFFFTANILLQMLLKSAAPMLMQQKMFCSWESVNSPRSLFCPRFYLLKYMINAIWMLYSRLLQFECIYSTFKCIGLWRWWCALGNTGGIVQYIYHFCYRAPNCM